MDDESSLVVVLNSNKELEYFRNRPLSKKQTEDLIKIDSKLALGFEISGQLMSQPSEKDKATYIANMLIGALINDNESIMSLCCSFLATRFTELKQVRATTHDDHYTIRLIYDQEFVEQNTVQFVNKKDLN
ncbi:MAG: hypothetical protein AAGB35_01385 [Pseudomonadota bacterium]